LAKQGKISGSLMTDLRDVYECPADRSPTLVDFYSPDGKVEFSEIPISYAYNLLLYTDQIPTHKLRNASRLVILFDAEKMVQHQGRWQDSPDFYLDILAERHSGGANHLFGDFHVEWRPLIDTENLIPE
jgi:prepilin-type processing-associated H-X9-DG protein